ncbi:Mor family transcriptional regulator [Anaerosolibacter carboniphilus]|uniref:Mor family transcriptional regulator n=1 Tax=Anaerosolibacter carboniphilus TaxID=1417629 RepID=A0A841KZT6_9FIRM|nr:CD3324 family protein [Anaerosolibacter carboniphilus]MBB6218877.1 Mor family transcriptional regulator [Anaerosolibacter carboniphilus]
MKYQNANNVLPEHLLLEIQQYVQGEYLYIPARQSCYKKWGEKSGIRKILAHRNKEIINKYKQGYAMSDLAEEYCLFVHSIKQIIYKK